MPKVPKAPTVPKVPKVSRTLQVPHLFIVFVVALGVRLLHIWQLRVSPFSAVLFGDSRAYHDWAARLARGDWIGTEVFYQAPLYPYFLGTIYAIAGPDWHMARIVQAVLGSIACVILALAGTRLFSARAGFIAGLMLALYAPAIFLDALIQKSVLDVFIVCVTLWLVSQLVSRPDRRRWWLGLGVALGALSLTRENALALVAVTVAWATFGDWQTRRVQLARTGAVLIGLAIVLAPVAARNLAVGGEFQLTTAQLGPNLYIGNNPRASGTYTSLREGREDPAYERQDATALAEAATGRRLTAGEVSAYWRDRALQYIASEPWDWVILVGQKLLLLVSATEMIDTEAQESHAEWSAPLRWGGIIGHFGVLLPLAVVGIAVTWTDRRTLLIIYLLAIAYAASVLLFFVVARYRYPLIPFAILFAAAGVARLNVFLRDATRSQRAALATVVIGVAALTQTPTLSADIMRAITETNVGVALQEQGRLEPAIASYRRAIDVRPDYAPAYNNLGVALRAQGRLGDAIAAYRHALERRPDYPEVHYNLATALLEHQKPQEAVHHFRIAGESLPATAAAQGRLGDAIAAYRHALERRPDYPEVHYNLATALLEYQKPQEAVQHFRIAGESLPATAAAHNNFGVALAAAGLRDDAIGQFRAALAIEPDSPKTLRNLGDALARKRQYAEAIACFRRIVALDAGNPAAHYDLGNVLMEAGQLAAAAEEFRATIALAPESAQAHNNLGVALAAQGYMNDAVAAFERAVALKPDFVEARRYLEMARRSANR